MNSEISIVKENVRYSTTGGVTFKFTSFSLIQDLYHYRDESFRKDESEGSFGCRIRFGPVLKTCAKITW